MQHDSTFTEPYLASRSNRTFRTWEAMLGRCLNPRWINYHNYGGRGITICDRWREDFRFFAEDMGPRPIGKTIDRIDSNGNYEPGNCRWATHSEQHQNQRNTRWLAIDGVTKTIREWSEEYGVPIAVIKSRLRDSPNFPAWPPEKAVKTPSNNKARTYEMTSPTGERYITNNMNAFCREHGLAPGNMQKVFTGECKQHHGWKGRRLYA